MGTGKAQLFCLVIHLGDKLTVAAGVVFCQSNTGVITRADQQAIEQVFDRQLISPGEVDRLPGGIARRLDGEDLIKFVGF